MGKCIQAKFHNFFKNLTFIRGHVRADLHGTIFVACDNGFRQAHDMIYDCCVRQKKCRSILKHVLRADLHGAIFVACGNGLRQAHDMIYDCCVRQKKCRSILKHVLKRCDNRKSCRRPVVSLSHATKIVPSKPALTKFELEYPDTVDVVLVVKKISEI